MREEIIDRLEDFENDDGFDPKVEVTSIRKFSSVLEANLFSARLKSEGIRCFVANADSVTFVPVEGGIRLFVRKDQKDLALQILQDMEAKNVAGNEHYTFYEADKEDIAFEKALRSREKNVFSPILFIVAILILLLVVRAILRALSLVPTFDLF